MPKRIYDAEAVPDDRLVWLINIGTSGPEARGSFVVVDFLDGRVYSVINWRA